MTSVNLGWACLTVKHRIIEFDLYFGEHCRIKRTASQNLGKGKANISFVHTKIKDEKQNKQWPILVFALDLAKKKKVFSVMHFKCHAHPVCDLVLSQRLSWLTASIFRKAFISVLLEMGHFEVLP